MIQIEFNQEKIELPQECSVADFIKDNPNKQNVVGEFLSATFKTKTPPQDYICYSIQNLIEDFANYFAGF